MIGNNGTNPHETGETMCREPKLWLASGIFPVEFADRAGPGSAADTLFPELLDRLWRAALADAAARETYWRYRPLPTAEEAVVVRLEAFGRLHWRARDKESHGHLGVGLASGDDGRIGSAEDAVIVGHGREGAACDHEACYQEWFETCLDWQPPLTQRLRALLATALAGRGVAKSCWPGLGAPINRSGQPPVRRWPRPRPRPWEEAADGVDG